MNIQISVIIWTVICFVLLMLILRNLLFMPVLKVMDKRRERIEKATLKNAEEQRLIKEHEEGMALKKAELAEQHQAQVRAQIEQIQSDSKRAVMAANKERLCKVEDYREASQNQYEEIVLELKPSVAALAAAFADKIVSE